MFPREIIKSIFTPEEYDAMTEYLDIYQNTRPEWKDFRAKIKPPVLLEKWQKILNKCRENGFIAPYVKDGEIFFNQILSHARNKKNADRCTLCNDHFSTGRCRGQVRMENGRRNFVFCWQGAG